MKIDIRKTLTIGSAALGLLALPSFAMAAGGDDVRYGGMGHMGGGHARDQGGELGRPGRGLSEDRGVRAFRERVRERHLARGDREREVRGPARECVPVARRYDSGDRERAAREPVRERAHLARRFGYEGGDHVRRFAFGGGFPGRGYGPAFRPAPYGFGYGRPRGRLVRVCTVRFLPFR